MQADGALASWTRFQEEMAGNARNAQARWQAAASASAALRQAAASPAVQRVLDPAVHRALGPALPAEPPWRLTALAPASVEPALFELMTARAGQLAVVERLALDVERAADALAWLTVTARDLDAASQACGEAGCARFLAEEQAARGELASAADALARAQRAAAEGARRLGDARTTWNEAVRTRRIRDAQLEEQVARADRAPLTRELQALQAFVEPALQAEAQAVQNWARAWQAVHGEPPQLSTQGPVLEVRAGAEPPDLAPASGMRWSGVDGHALHRLTEIHTEPEGFGAYTYVIVLTRLDSARDEVRQRLLRIERTVRDLVPARDVPAARRGRFNAFVMPIAQPGTDGGRDPGPDAVPYDVRLAQQLAMHVPASRRLPPGIRQAQLSQPGPFLLSLPLRLADARPDSPMLFADLSDTPPLAVADVVKAYMRGLELPDLSDAAVRGWRPPTGLTVASTLVRVSQTTGELFSAFFPSAVAATR